MLSSKVCNLNSTHKSYERTWKRERYLDGRGRLWWRKKMERLARRWIMEEQQRQQALMQRSMTRCHRHGGEPTWHCRCRGALTPTSSRHEAHKSQIVWNCWNVWSVWCVWNESEARQVRAHFEAVCDPGFFLSSNREREIKLIMLVSLPI